MTHAPEYERIEWEQILATQEPVLRADNGDHLTVKEAKGLASDGLSVLAGGIWAWPKTWEASGFYPYRIKAGVSEIPTEPGAYYDKANNLWEIDEHGTWIVDGDVYRPEEIVSLAPFTRLVSLPTAEQVRNKMFDAIFGSGVGDASVNRATAAVMQLLRGEGGDQS